MRISFLHLSDFHLNDSKGVHPAKIQAIVDSLGVYTPIEGIVIVLSGDIAATGQANQYKIVATFLKRLIPEIRRKYSISEKNTKILIVPGNHDIDWGRSTRLDSSKIRSFDEKERALHLQQELKSMKNYFSFSDRNGCFFPYWMHIPFGQLVTRKILHFDNGYRIEANLLNTAPFSCDSDDGLHYLPEDAIHSLTTESNADFSLVVMHHSPDWFEFSQKKELENTLSKRCSLAFYGHEHFPGTQNVLYDNGNRIVKQAGGAWWQSSVPTLSDYYAALFDTESRKYFLSKFSWNADRSAFVATMKQEHILMQKSLCGTGLTYQEKYIATVMADSKSTIAQSVSDYFVFPTLRLNASKEYSRGKAIDKMEDFIAFIKENRYVAVMGGSNSGKTTLLKMTFKELQTQYVVLYCGTDDITGRSQENILKELVTDTYGADSYSLFQAIPSDKKVIIIDDLHRISPKHLNKFLRGIEDIFGTIVVASEETSQFDIVQMVKDNIKASKEFKKASISRLYAEKRLALIQKIVLIKTDNDELKAAGIARTLEQCLNSYKLAFRTDIDFVVQFVDYYCAHLGELDKSDATVFSKVFEASIERSIAPHLVGRKENSNDIIVALSEIAHYIHFNKEYPINAEHIYFDKSQRNTIDKWSDIRAKFIRTILASHLCDHMIRVDCPSEIFKINQFQAVVSIDENGIKLPAQIIVFQHCFQSIDNFLDICGSQGSSIDPIDCITKNIDQNVGIVVDDSFIFSQRDVFISQTSEMHQCRNFDSRVFIVRHCAILLCGRISFFLMISTYKCGFDCRPL